MAIKAVALEAAWVENLVTLGIEPEALLGSATALRLWTRPERLGEIWPGLTRIAIDHAVVVVDTPDALLVPTRSRAPDVELIVDAP